MTIQKKRIFASVLFVLISIVCSAQMPVPGPPPPPGTPIDGGVLIGICFALVYGVKKMVKRY